MADKLAAELAPMLGRDVRIVTSPSRRAKATAAAIAARLDDPSIDADERWLETDVGLAEGLTFDEVASRWPTLAADLAAGFVEITWPGGETARALERRISEAWSAVVAAGRPTLVVSHAGSIRVATAIATGRPVGEVEFLGPGAWVRHEVPTADVDPTAQATPTVQAARPSGPP